MQPLLLFYVDAAEQLSHDDPQWELLVAVSRSAAQPESPPRVLGFLTYYRYYAFPHHERVRVAQILVMPPFQRQGVGRCLLGACTQVRSCCQIDESVCYVVDAAVGMFVCNNIGNV